MKTAVTRLPIGLIVISLIFTFQSYVRFNPEEALGIWLFDEGKGDEVKDFSGHGYDGKLVNKPKWVDGKFGKALSFDGVNQYVEMNDPVNIPEMNHSISVWVNPGDTQRTNSSILGNHTEPALGYNMQQNDGNVNLFYSSYGGGGKWSGAGEGAGCSTQLTAGVWQHFAIVREKDTMTHYLNGKKSAFKSGINPALVAPSPNKFVVGEWSVTWGRPFNGMIDEVLIINRVLTMDEIESLMNRGIEGGFAVSNKGKLAITWGNIKTQ